MLLMSTPLLEMPFFIELHSQMLQKNMEAAAPGKDKCRTEYQMLFPSCLVMTSLHSAPRAECSWRKAPDKSLWADSPCCQETKVQTLSSSVTYGQKKPCEVSPK